MCGVYGFMAGISATQFADLAGITNLPKNWQDFESFKITPKSHVATVSKQSPNQLIPRIWWLAPPWVKDPYHVKFATFNARSEDIATKPAFRHAWSHSQRCLIPASFFIEWQTNDEGKKLPHKIKLKDAPVFFFAGLYEDTPDAEGNIIATCTILTTHSVPPLSTIHARQPIIINHQDRETWLSPETSPQKAIEFLKPNPNLTLTPIDPRFNKQKATDITSEPNSKQPSYFPHQQTT